MTYETELEDLIELGVASEVTEGEPEDDFEGEQRLP